MKRMRVGTKLLLLAMLPVCAVVALVIVSVVSDYRTASRLSRYRSQARLSFALAPLAVDLQHERRAAVLVGVSPGAASDALLASYEPATTQAFAQARARAARVTAPVDVAGGLDAARRQRRALVLQLSARSLAPGQAVAGYSVITQKMLALAAALDAGAPSPASARAAAAYGPILQTIESASRERVFVATLLARRGRRPQPTASPWPALENAELNAFRQNAAGPLVSDLDAALFSPSGTAVQRFRDELAANPAAAMHATSLQRWLAISGDRIDALRGVSAAAGRSLVAVVSSELDSAHSAAVRDLVLSLAFLMLVTALALVLRRSITRPLREVSAAARGLAHGDIAAGVDYSTRDEIGDVAAAFRDVHGTAERLVGEIDAKNRAIRENRLDHRVDVSGFEGVWSQLVAGMNDTMAAFGELQEHREHAERETARIFEMSLDLLCVIGFDGFFKRVNPAVERTLGYSREVLLSRRGFDFTHPDDLERSRELFSALRQGRRVEQFENRNVCADGSVRWLQWSARAVPEEGVMYAVGRDITESRRAAQEEAALRRVATLVARGVAPEVVFATVAEEMGKVLPAVDLALIGRYTSDQSIEFVGGWSNFGTAEWVGGKVKIGGSNVSTAVFETERPARVDQLQDDATAVTAVAREMGARSSAGAPIKIEGQLWGVMTVASLREHGLPLGVEHELAAFIELVATAIANADGRAQLVAARRRVIEATDGARAQLARDIHDGAQQQFLTALIDLQLAQQKRSTDPGRSRELVDLGAAQVEKGVETLRELAAGVHPAILSDMGLKPALEALAARMPLPLSLDVDDFELTPALEVSVYFFCSETLANVVKHAAASSAWVRIDAVDGELMVEVGDDGIGGAEMSSGGTGLIGLGDRIGALGGSLTIASPRDGKGTKLVARIPLPSRADS
jgi:PAS domain S-box-containing protein